MTLMRGNFPPRHIAAVACAAEGYTIPLQFYIGYTRYKKLAEEITA